MMVCIFTFLNALSIPHSNIVRDIFTDFVYAENEEAAIEIAFDCLNDEIIDIGLIPVIDYDSNIITIYNNKWEIVEQWYNFIAEIIE